ncbi:hypothetical protein [Embleya sp. NPDC020630]|uniref:hypothetical protein n=1 Tax=Embleya sp. NPDC020630 TaxID=3363979 RepID=UPI00378AFEBD
MANGWKTISAGRSTYRVSGLDKHPLTAFSGSALDVVHGDRVPAASWYCALGDIPLDGVVAHHVASDGSWPDHDPCGDVERNDVLGPLPDHAAVNAWRERCTAALGSGHLPADLDGDRLATVLLRFNTLPMLIDELRAGDPDGRRRRIAWRSAPDVAYGLGAGP